MSKPTIEIDFNGPQGNIFCVLLEANKAIESLAFAGGSLSMRNATLINAEMRHKVSKATSYKDALNIIEEYVTIKPKGGLPMK